MTTAAGRYLQSELEGEDAGGFVVVNVNARMANSVQILSEEGGAYFQSLEQARAACRRWREESDNQEIFIYALVGVREAIEWHPDDFLLE